MKPADPKCDHGDHILCNECMEPAGLDQAQLHADDCVDYNYPDVREVLKLKKATMNEPQWTYQDIVNHFVKIIGNGTFTVETINESILLKMLDSKGIKIPVEKSYRDIDKDYKMHLQDIGITMNEPQLSSEMEEELQIVIGESLDKIDNQDGSSLISQGNFETAGFILPEVLHFLATVLEKEREKVLSEVEDLLVNEEFNANEIYADSQFDTLRIINRNDLRAELRTKLTEMKARER